MEEYLKTREDVRLVRSALSIARTLEESERKLEEARREFKKASQVIADSLKIELWHTDASGGEYFWKRQGRESVHYPDRVSALRALHEEIIEWK